jgi:glutaredoxin
VIVLTIYSRPGCHLCDDMKALVARIVGNQPAAATVTEVDISADPALEERYGLEIPVLLVDGKKVAKYRVSEDALRRILAGQEEQQAGGAGKPG